MTLETVWLALLGFLLGGYFVLGGYDYGVQLLRPWLAPDEPARRSSLAALGPYFFGNEVWLVAFAGVLFGAFPFLEGTLLSGMYPLMVAIITGLAIGKAAIQLRGRTRGALARRIWDVLIFLGGLIPAWTWGMLIGVLLHGVPRGADGHFTLPGSLLAGPSVLACGAATTALFATHGAAFLAVRMRGRPRRRARTVLPYLAAAAIATAAIAGLAALAGGTDIATNPAAAGMVAAALPLGLLAAVWATRRGHTKTAFAATGTTALVPALLPGVAHYPYLLVSTVADGHSMTVGQAAADGATLALLTSFGVIVVPLILLYQVWGWWAFRGRVDEHTTGYF